MLRIHIVGRDLPELLSVHHVPKEFRNRSSVSPEIDDIKPAE
jgi:hypothetical protein